jgi:hypothetical protein
MGHGQASHLQLLPDALLELPQHRFRGLVRTQVDDRY